MKLTVGIKIGLAFALAVIFFLLLGGVSYLANDRLVEAIDKVEQSHDLLSHLHDVQSDLYELVSDGRGFLLTGAETYLQSFQKLKLQITEKLNQTRKLTDKRYFQEKLNLFEQKQADVIREQENLFEMQKQKGLEQVGQTMKSGKSQQLLGELERIHEDMDNAETKYLELIDKESHEKVRFTKAVILLGIPTMAILLGLAGGIITRNIAKPLKEMAKTSEYMAAGDLIFNFTAHDRDDEVGVLEETFTKVIHYQREMAEVANQLAVGDLSAAVKPRSDKDMLGQAFERAIQYQREMADLAHQIALGNLAVTVKPRSDKDVLGQSMKTMVSNMRQHLEQITEGISALAAAASEITATSSQIASGATQTATAVTETTATIEELRQTIHLSSQKAREVSDNSQMTAQVSLDGKKAVDETIEGMTRIRRQMDSIAESIVKLSEQSQAIGAIIATVNDMADQSNLLAVNASIEAAKAGEQGKGFAVVAQEVRNLAEQSKQATAQVRSILNDIQKAISSAVMATEQGGKVVDIGVKQSSEAGASILTLSDSVSSSAQASVQIVAATNEQLVGMDQVAQAMESIKQAGDQNVFGVRQVETAIHNLNSLGQNLKQMVEHYQV